MLGLAVGCKLGQEAGEPGGRGACVREGGKQARPKGSRSWQLAEACWDQGTSRRELDTQEVVICKSCL